MHSLAERAPEDIVQAARIFKALSHPSRLELACRLSEGAASQKELIAATGLPQSSVARLLVPLRALGLVAPERRGASGELALAVSSPVIGALVNAVCDWLHGEGPAANREQGA